MDCLLKNINPNSNIANFMHHLKLNFITVYIYTDRAWVLRDLWTGAFDVQVVVPTTERPRGLEHLDPLRRYLQGHVLGRIPEGALVTESIS